MKDTTSVSWTNKDNSIPLWFYSVSDVQHLFPSFMQLLIPLRLSNPHIFLHFILPLFSLILSLSLSLNSTSYCSFMEVYIVCIMLHVSVKKSLSAFYPVSFSIKVFDQFASGLSDHASTPRHQVHY